MKYRWLLAIGIVLLGVTGWLLLRSYAAPSTLERIQQRGIVRIGYAPEAPFALRTMQGDVIGEGPQVAAAVFQQMGINRIEWIQTEWSNLIPELLQERYDVIATGMFITCERARQVRFSEPTFQVNSGMIVQIGNPFGIHEYADFVRRSELRLAVINGAYEQRLAAAEGIPASQILLVPDALTGAAAVQTGRVEAMAISDVSAQHMARTNPEIIEVVTPFFLPTSDATSHGGLAVRPADTELAQAINSQLDSFIGSPEHLALIEPLGFTSANLPTRSLSTLLAPECHP